MLYTKKEAERRAREDRREAARRRTLARIRSLREEANRLERVLEGKP